MAELKAELNRPTVRIITDPQQVLVLLTILQILKASVSSGPVHLVVVVDVSGSMAGVRIETAKKAMKMIIYKLRPGDALSIIACNTKATVICERLTIGDASEIEQQIDALQANGGTHLHEGIEKGLSSIRHGEQRIIIFVTDGQSFTLEQDLEAARQAGSREIPIYAAGIEADYAETQKHLTQIGQLSNGSTAYLSDPSEIIPFISKSVETAQSHTITHTTLEITTLLGCKIKDYAKYKPLIDPATYSGPTTNHKVIIGSVNEKEPYQSLLRLEVDEKTTAGTYVIAKAKLTYVEGSVQKISEADIKLNFSVDAPAPSLNDIDKAFLSIESKRCEAKGDLAMTQRYNDAIGDKKMSALVGKMMSGKASNAEKSQYEACSTKREYAKPNGGNRQ